MNKYHQGIYSPKRPEKYLGDPTQIIYRSGWELRAFMRLDENPEVLKWSSEEIIIPYRSPADGKIHRYFPDLLVKKKDGIYLLEIKPFIQTMPPVRGKKSKKKFLTEVLTFGINQAKWDAATQFAESRGWKFSTITEKDLGITF